MSTILVVDDHELTRKTLHRRLEKAGHAVIEAPNAKSGIKLLQSKAIDLILLDFMMKNMNGMQTFEKMKELKPEVPCAMITAYAHSGLIKQFMAEGGVDFMIKPIGEDFETRVSALLQGKDNPAESEENRADESEEGSPPD